MSSTLTHCSWKLPLRSRPDVLRPLTDCCHEASVPSLQLRVRECSQGRLACSSVGTGPEDCGHGNRDDDEQDVSSQTGDCSQNLPTSQAVQAV